MASWTQDSYLTTEVMTATPQKLQLLLLEAALRFAERARLHWKAAESEQACEALIRSQEIVAYILGGLNSESNPELTKKVAGIYLFIYRSLVEANLRQDESKLNDAIRVLEIERETWRQVCESCPGGGASASESFETSELPFRMPTFETASMPPLDLSSDPGGAGGSYSGFSLEA